jgi:hypothetical protein
MQAPMLNQFFFFSSSWRENDEQRRFVFNLQMGGQK